MIDTPVALSDHCLNLPISTAAWERLVAANRRAVDAGWATEGVFATGIGPAYRPGSATSLLYVGKSAGPLGHAVGSCFTRGESIRASTEWMVQRKNQSAFSQFVDKIDSTRTTVAWTNICKMDRIGGQRPPSETEWRQVAVECIAALVDEIAALKPAVTVFATSGIYNSDVGSLLFRFGYAAIPVGFDDGWTSCYRAPAGRYAITTKHPQGWDSASRDRVTDLTIRLLGTDRLSSRIMRS
jgi:hypothetical protein